MKRKYILAPYLTGAIVFATVLAIFWQVRGFDYLNFDDNVYITTNPHVHSGISQENLVWAFTEVRGGHWHPLTWISLMLDCEFFGLNASVAHLENAFIHALNAVLLFIVVSALGLGIPRATFIALLFALHPLRIESVAWITERKDVLSMAFFLISILGYVQFVRSHRLWWYSASLLSLALSLMAKPTFITFPLLVLLLDFWPLRRFEIDKNPKRLVLEKIPYLLLACASAISTVLAQRADGALHTLSQTPLDERLANSSVGFLGYLGRFFWPQDIAIFYPQISYPPGVAVGAFLAILTLSIYLYQRRSSHPFMLFGWSWFVVSLLPVIGLVQIGGQALADRWSYAPHIGFIIALAMLPQLFPRRLTRATPYLACAIVVACALKTLHELPHWRSSEALFRHTLEVSPQNFMAHTNLGTALEARGDIDGASFHYEEAYRLNPGYPEAINNVGIVRAKQNRLDEAIALFEKALAIRPSFEAARHNLQVATTSSVRAKNARW